MWNCHSRGHVLMGTDMLEIPGPPAENRQQHTINIELEERAEAGASSAALRRWERPIGLHDMRGLYWGTCADRYGVPMDDLTALQRLMRTDGRSTKDRCSGGAPTSRANPITQRSTMVVPSVNPCGLVVRIVGSMCAGPR